MYYLIRMYAWLFRKKIVVLLHHDGTVTYSIPYVNAYRQMVAKVHWPMDIYTVVLCHDHTCRGYHIGPSYVERWKLWS